MNTDQMDFLTIIETENRYKALQFVMDRLEKKELSVLEVYEEILAPALNLMVPTENENVDIWKEHVRTSIIKTILENAYPYVIKEKEEKSISINKTVAVLCPPEEYHNVGARMVTDILTILGYDAIFVDSNTPLRVIEAGMDIRKIDCIAISISNPYHLVSTRNIIEAIHKKDASVKIIVGGNAIKKAGAHADLLKADYIVTSLKELENLEGGTSHETSI